PGDISEQGTYLGLPLIAIVLVYLFSRWRERAVRVMLALLAVALVWSLGSRLTIDGYQTIKLPGTWFDGLPLADQLQPVRLGEYVALIAAVCAALWLRRGGGRAWRRWFWTGVAIVFLIPNPHVVLPSTGVAAFHAETALPPFFSTDAYKRYLRPGEVVLPLPDGRYGTSMLWQASTGMYFNLASGRFTLPPAAYTRDGAILQQLLYAAPIDAGTPAA